MKHDDNKTDRVIRMIRVLAAHPGGLARKDFNPGVAERVLENSWHETENTETLGDGLLLWKAAISQPREMFPWIRGWGADVEVNEPAWMRDAIREEMGRMRKIYGSEH